MLRNYVGKISYPNEQNLNSGKNRKMSEINSIDNTNRQNPCFAQRPILSAAF